MAIKKFRIGNQISPALEELVYVGDVAYTAKLVCIGGWDPVTEESAPDKDIPLPLGVDANLDLEAYTNITLRADVVSGFRLVSFDNLYYSTENYTLTDSLLTYKLTNDEITKAYIGLREYILVGEAIPVVDTTKKPFNVGNLYDAGGIHYNGEITYTAKVMVTTPYDPIEETPESTQTIDINLGQETIVTVLPNQTAQLALTVLPGFEFVSFSNIAYPDNEYFLTPTAIAYDLSQDEINGLADNMFKYVATTRDSAEIVGPDTVVNSYLLNAERFKAFESELFSIASFEGVSGKTLLVTEFVPSVKLLPFKISSEDIYNTQPIKVRNYTLTTLGEFLNKDYVTIDFGEIEVAAEYGNALDVVGVSCDLIMPFKQGAISLESTYVVGKKISIIGRLNVSQGEITVTVFNSDGVAFNVSNFNIGSDYPLYSAYKIENNIFSPNQALNDIDKAYILVSSPVYSITPKINKRGVLAGAIGRVEISEISVDNIPYADEYNRLINELENGVIIK